MKGKMREDGWMAMYKYTQGSIKFGRVDEVPEKQLAFNISLWKAC